MPTFHDTDYWICLLWKGSDKIFFFKYDTNLGGPQSTKGYHFYNSTRQDCRKGDGEEED